MLHSFVYYPMLYFVTINTIRNPLRFKDKGFIVCRAEVSRGVCSGCSAGLPFSVFLSEIVEWDQTVIRTKTAQKQEAHTDGFPHACVHDS